LEFESNFSGSLIPTFSVSGITFRATASSQVDTLGSWYTSVNFWRKLGLEDVPEAVSVPGTRGVSGIGFWAELVADSQFDTLGSWYTSALGGGTC
jgi:hypothetical protein